MKKSALTTTISILLIVSCLFALAAAGFGVRDGLAIKQYKEEDAKSADVVGELEKAIEALKANEDDYNEGVGTYAKGLSDYAAGQQAYNEGKATLAQGYKDYNEGKATLEQGYRDYEEGKATLEQGYKDYEAGKKALEEGRQKIAEGQEMIDENTDAYNEGKELLSKIEPLMPLLNTYVKFRDGSVAKLPGFDSAQAWFAGKVAPLAERMGLSIPADVTDFPAYIQAMVAEGQAMLKQYEDGLAELEAGKAELAAGEQQLAEAEKQLAQGEKDLAAGKKALEDGESELAAGKKALEDGESELAAGAKELADGAARLEAGRNDLEAFENGMALVDEYTMTCYKNEPIYRHNGDMAVPGPEQRLGEDFDWKKYDENGELVTLRNGEPYLDLDRCLVVCKSFRESVAHHVADVTHELYMRLGLYVVLAVAAILGIIGGVLGLAGKRGAFVLGIITAVLAAGCNIFGLLTRYHGYTYPLKDGTYSGTLQLIAIIIFALTALVFLVVTASARNKAAVES